MNKNLSKRIILSPDQLQRLLGRDRLITDRYAHERDKAIISAVKGAPSIGASQAYAQFSTAQQRHLQHAAKDRNAPLELLISETDNNNSKISGESLKKKKAKKRLEVINKNKRKRVEEDELNGVEQQEEGERFAKIKTPRIGSNTKRKRENSEEGNERPASNNPSIPSAATFSPLSTRSGRQRLTPRRRHAPLPWLRYGEVG
jgi:hypothetical protein